MQTSYPVIICGAGPTGLMLAAQLLRFDIDFLIIDKKSKPTDESRALVVQARSMEIYEQMYLSEEILSNATSINGICFWRKGKRTSNAQTSFENIGADITPFGSLLIYEQSKNEALLYHYLQKQHREVAWNTELIAYAKTKEGYSVVLKQGLEEMTVSTTYLIACDGGNSLLREMAGVGFVGGTYEHVFYVADTHVKADLCSNSLNFFVAKDTFNIFFPMLGVNRFRAIGILPKQYYHQADITYDDVSKQVYKDAGMNLGFYDTDWYSTYKLHHKKVTKFNVENLFFCGDAAHVHSPAGGQGMNTGLQDAYNLAWKLAFVIKKIAKPTLLNTYHEERNPVAEDLLKSTDRLFALMSQDKWLSKLMRMYIAPFLVPILFSIKSLRRKFFLMTSQTKISYSKSSISKGKNGSVTAGMRFPYFLIHQKGQEESVYHLIRTNAQNSMLLLCYNLAEVPVTKLNGISIVALEPNGFNKKSLQKVGFTSSFACLIRPDNYIGYINEVFDYAAFQQYADSWMV